MLTIGTSHTGLLKKLFGFRIQFSVFFRFCRTKRAQQVSSPLPPCPDLCTPTKSGVRTGTKVTPDVQTPCPEPSKVTFSSELDLLAELYSTCISGKWPLGRAQGLKQDTNGKIRIKTYENMFSSFLMDILKTKNKLPQMLFISYIIIIFEINWSLVFSNPTENLVPNIFLELFFVMQLLTSRSTHTHDDDEQEVQCAPENSGLKVLCIILAFNKKTYNNINCEPYPPPPFSHRCSWEVLPKTSTQLCVFCSEGSEKSISVSSICASFPS